MSMSDLKKIPTEWLDYYDRKAAETFGEERQLSVGSNRDWEVIGISSSRDVSPSRPCDQSQNSGGMSRNASRRKYPTHASLTTDQERSDQDEGIMLQLCGGSHRIFGRIGFSEMGTGRLIGTRLLLMLRLLILFIHGISAGFSYALREKVSIKFLLSELFIWLHLAFLFLMPMLLLSTILTIRWNFLRGIQGEGEEPPKQGERLWLTTEILYQVVMVLAQTELVRLLVMHSVPSLRPIVDYKGVELVYSVTNAFAVQRYLIVASTVVDAISSTVPLRFENGIFAVLVYIPFASASLFSRPTASSTVVKIGYLFGFTAITVMLTLLNVLIYRVLSSCSHRRKERNNDRPKPTVDMV